MSAPPLILLVEDDRLLRQAFRLLLEDAGYRVREAGSGGEALGRRRKGRRPSCSTSACPTGRGSKCAARSASTPATRNAVIVALTGRAGAAEQRACLEAGCTLYFAKPIEPRELLRRLSGFVP